MSPWLRWRLATPLIVLCLMTTVAALYGTVAWWSDYGIVYQTLSVVICVIVIAQLGLAISIGVRPVKDIPWFRIGLIVLGFLVSCGLARLRREF